MTVTQPEQPQQPIRQQPNVTVNMGKSTLTAYVLWFFLGMLSVHQFYMKAYGRAWLQLLTLQFCFVGLFIDLFTMSGQVDRANRRIARSYQQSV